MRLYFSTFVSLNFRSCCARLLHPRLSEILSRHMILILYIDRRERTDQREQAAYTKASIHTHIFYRAQNGNNRKRLVLVFAELHQHTTYTRGVVTKRTPFSRYQVPPVLWMEGGRTSSRLWSFGNRSKIDCLWTHFGSGRACYSILCFCP